jgi:Spy/CpxP family protein refolding chaperone
MALDLNDISSAAGRGITAVRELSKDIASGAAVAALSAAGVVAGAVSLDAERAEAAGVSITTADPLLKKGAKHFVDENARKLAEHELTDEQRNQLAKDRERVASASPYAANLMGGMPTKLMRDVEDRARAISAEAEKEAERRLLSPEEQKKLGEERKVYEDQMDEYRRKMATTASLMHRPEPPTPGATMLMVKELGRKILSERAAEIA